MNGGGLLDTREEKSFNLWGERVKIPKGRP